jgi:hypothetical protein
MNRVPLSIPAVTIRQPPAPSASSNRKVPQATSPVEIQCIAHHEATDAWPDGHLNQWLSEGWEVMRTVRQSPRAFFYLRRPRSDIPRA